MAAPSPLIGLLPHTISSLPTHPSLASTISAQNTGEVARNPDHLLRYAQTLLAEAIEFTDTYLPLKFKPKSTKSSRPATAKVELLEHIRLQKSNEETWFARRSKHVNKAEPGTATFAEIDAGLRQEHSLHEMQYTPDVFDAYEVLSWDSEMPQPAPSATNGFASSSNTTSTCSQPIFTEISMRIYEMCHSLPAPLQPRVFSVLVASAKTGPDSFVVVQVPINIKSVPAAFYSNGRNAKEGTSPEKRKEPVIGIYTSIERCKVLPTTGEVEWVMATASDARGALPMWMQKMGTPGAVVKDVGLFIQWVQSIREKKKGRSG